MQIPALASLSPQTAELHDERQAAQQFEALLIGLLLRSARESSGSGGWLGTGEDRSSESMAELAEQAVAQLLSGRGGLGLADMIAEGLSQKPSQNSSDGLATSPRSRIP